MKVLTVFNHAGGAGKTSLSRELGYEMSVQGVRVLLIDLDPQANLTTWLGISDVQREETVHGVAVEGQDLPKPRRAHGMDVMPSHVSLALVEGLMMGRVGAHMRLRRALSAVKDQYDLVVIDSPPSLGQLSILGAMAADQMVVPVPTRQKGLDALPGLSEAFLEYQAVKPDLTVAIYVPTLYDSRRLHDREVLAELQANLSPVAQPVPQREAVWLDSTTAGQPVGVYAPNSPVHKDVQQLVSDVAKAAGLPFKGVNA
ncbi:sporulation initiation inhibitor protein Soj [Deinococcus xinjiangensis]|uniref:Sporulation initiation inhibitor protein Soj n=1 Tax=Deinococcus xinjiangensis TaxID=457454 RepID=A0ABP9VCX5_9DEIO